MLRAVPLLLALIACGSRSSTRPDDASARPADGAPDLDAAPLGDAPASSDASPLLDASQLLDAMAPPLDGAPQPDAGSTTPNTVSCYTQASPTTTCALPTHCCFSNFDAQHNGDCTTTACAWGTISCDGPEDCAGGQRCCAHAIIDPDQGLTGYTLACQAGPCGAAPANQELCHAGTCSTGTCVSALGHDNDLPRALNICQ